MKTVVVTHPEFTCQNFSIEDQVALADKGCLIERCLTTPHSGKTTYEHVFEGVRAVGIERNFFSSDCGNPDYPPVEDGQAIWADKLLEAGFSDDEIRTMVVEGSRRLVAVSRRLLVIGAHSADFVWRAGGAIAVTTAGGGTAQVLALSYGERGRVGRALEGRGDDGRARQGGPRARRPSARPRTWARASRASTSATTRWSSTRTG